MTQNLFILCFTFLQTFAYCQKNQTKNWLVYSNYKYLLKKEKTVEARELLLNNKDLHLVFNSEDYFTASKLILKLEETMALDYLDSAIVTGYFYNNQQKLLNDIDYQSAYGTKKLSADYKKFSKIFNKRFDKKIYDELLAISKVDKELRLAYMKDMKNKEAELKYLKNDSMNFPFIDKILHHPNFKFWNKYLPFQSVYFAEFLHTTTTKLTESEFYPYAKHVEAMVKDGIIGPGIYAYWYDRFLSWKYSKPTLYGNLQVFKDNKMHIESVLYPHKIDSIRINIGLDSISTILTRNNNYEIPEWYRK